MMVLLRSTYLTALRCKTDVDDFMGQSFSAGDSFTLHLLATYEFLDGKIRKVTIVIGG